jgi:hypothetical protein
MKSPRNTGGVIRGGGKGPFQRLLHGGLAGRGGVSSRSRRCPLVRRGARPPEAVGGAVLEMTAAGGIDGAREASTYFAASSSASPRSSQSESESEFQNLPDIDLGCPDEKRWNSLKLLRAALGSSRRASSLAVIQRRDSLIEWARVTAGITHGIGERRSPELFQPAGKNSSDRLEEGG